MFSVTPTSTWPRVVIAIGLPFVLVSVLLIFLLNRELPWYGWVALGLSVAWLAWSLVQTLLDVREIGLHQEAQEKAKSQKTRRSSDETVPSQELPNEDLISLVYLLDEPRTATLPVVRRLLESTLGQRFDSQHADEVGFLTKLEPAAPEPVERYYFRTEWGGFSLLLCAEPYIDDPGEFAQRMIRDKRLRTAVESHQAWVSVDYSEPTNIFQETGRAEIYGVVGKIAASLAGPDCLAIYCPELARCNEFDLEMMERLREGDPRDIFDEPTHEPIIEVSEDDPRMQAAVQEAVDRWPEFVAAFEGDPAGVVDESYIIKAEFEESGHSEFMWLAVLAIDGDDIRGRLMNEPHRLEDYHRGQEVEVDFTRLNDWLYPGPENTPIGGFTLAILSDDIETD